MFSRRISPPQIALSLALLALTACTPARSGVSAVSETGRPAANTPRVVASTPRPATSPIVVSGSSPASIEKRAGTTVGLTTEHAIGAPGAGQAAALQTPPDHLEIVTVHDTNGYGVWMRTEPAGASVKVWPEGAPMLVTGPDRTVNGRIWRNVRSVDGERGWVAADYLLPADVQTYVQAASLLLDASTHPLPPSASPAPAASARGVASPTPRTAARRSGSPPGRAPAPSPADAHLPASAAVSATPTSPGASAAVASTAGNAASASASAPAGPAPKPSATPIKGPPGSRSIGVGDLRLTAGISETLPDLQIGNRPRPGMKLLAMEVTLENIGAEPTPVYRGGFRLALGDGTRLEPLAGREPSVPYSAALAPGDTLHGWLTFEAPADARPTSVLWSPERESTFAIDL